jgi:hypothetical protein
LYLLTAAFLFPLEFTMTVNTITRADAEAAVAAFDKAKDEYQRTAYIFGRDDPLSQTMRADAERLRKDALELLIAWKPMGEGGETYNERFPDGDGSGLPVCGMDALVRTCSAFASFRDLCDVAIQRGYRPTLRCLGRGGEDRENRVLADAFDAEMQRLHCDIRMSRT